MLNKLIKCSIHHDFFSKDPLFSLLIRYYYLHTCRLYCSPSWRSVQHHVLCIMIMFWIYQSHVHVNTRLLRCTALKYVDKWRYDHHGGVKFMVFWDVTTCGLNERCQRNALRKKEREDIFYIRCQEGGRDSSVGIVTRYGLDGPGIESRWGRDFVKPQDRCYQL
jgi:hypothetical protein